MLARPWARKSTEASGRDPSGLATAAPIPAAWASATRAIAIAPKARSGTGARSGTEKGGSDRGTLAMSSTSSTSGRRTALPTLTTSSAIRVAYARSDRNARKIAHTPTVATLTSTVVRSQSPMWTTASPILASVLCRSGS